MRDLDRVAGLLGEILVGLDRAGHLRRLVRPPAPPPEEAGPDGAVPERRPEPAGDFVDRLLSLIRDALAGADGRRLVRAGEDRWWLGERADREAAAAPLADRVEWAVYSLLSTAGPLSEAAFLDRIAGLFIGPDQPDEALVRACLDSYRSIASTQDVLLTTDDLTRRSQEHGELIAEIVDLGHLVGVLGAGSAPASSGARHAGSRSGSAVDRELSGPPYFGRIRGEDLEEVDVICMRGRTAFLWRVEWTAMLGDTVSRRHARMPPDERIVRLLVLPERSELVRHKLERSPLLRSDLEAGAWHIVKANHLRDWASHEEVALADMEGILGLDPAVERTGDQLALFGG